MKDFKVCHVPPFVGDFNINIIRVHLQCFYNTRMRVDELVSVDVDVFCDKSKRKFCCYTYSNLSKPLISLVILMVYSLDQIDFQCGSLVIQAALIWSVGQWYQELVLQNHTNPGKAAPNGSMNLSLAVSSPSNGFSPGPAQSNFYFVSKKLESPPAIGFPQVEGYLQASQKQECKPRQVYIQLSFKEYRIHTKAGNCRSVPNGTRKVIVTKI